ncbi:MAG: AraC family transcriptional regulator N-terminal domain-containing protein [Fimbriimonadaceae bacterium]
MASISDSRNERHQANGQELVERLKQRIPADGYLEPVPGVLLGRASNPGEKLYGVTRPSFCIVAQGAKEVYLGESVYTYDAHRCLVVTAELPIVGRIVTATPAMPYLSLLVEIDPAMVSSVMIEAGNHPPTTPTPKVIGVSALDNDLLDATLRLVRLLESPADFAVLGSLARREIIYRLLQGGQADRMRHLPLMGAQAGRIAQAVHRLKKDFDQPLSMEAVARDLGMSSSAFHRHFKAVTDMSPLQFQKQMRLQEARRLMLTGAFDAAGVGYKVGYDDPSHFSRDYKKQFGEPPLRDAQKRKAGT